MGKKSRIFILLFAVLFAVGSVFFGYQYNKTREKEYSKEDEKKELTTKESTQTSLKDKIDMLYVTDEKDFLTEKAVIGDLSQLEKEVSDSKQTEVKEYMKETLDKQKVTMALNDLFVTPALTNNQFDPQAELKPDVEQTSINQVGNWTNTQDEDLFYSGIHNYLSERGLLQDDLNQVSATQVQEWVNMIMSDGVVVNDFTLEQYDQIRNAIAALPVGQDKELLTQDLIKLQESLDLMGVSYEK